MRQIIYIRTLRIRAWPGSDPLRRVAPPRIERNVTPGRAPRNVTPQARSWATSRRIPVRVRGEGWLDKARRALGRLGLRAGAWMRNVAGP